MNIIIYYINLDRRNDRNDRIIQELKLINNIPIKRISAIDKNDLDMNKLIEEKYINEKTSLRLGQIACIFSHIKVWEEFLNSNYDYCIILEDDIKINKKYFNEKFFLILNEFNNIDCDWLYLGRNNLNHENFYKGDIINKFFYKPLTYGYGAHSYVLSKKGARKQLDYYKFKKNGYFFTNHPLDLIQEHNHLMKHFCKDYLKCLSILPYGGFDKYSNIKSSLSQEFLFHQKDISDTDTS
jgi:GR25 family glycosyltransferase involved in LPS biosynthesis